MLATRGATVALACRDPQCGQAALDRVRAATGGPDAALVQLDPADLGSVHKAADEVRAITGDRLDVLVNNASVMAAPPRRTVDGFELAPAPVARLAKWGGELVAQPVVAGALPQLYAITAADVHGGEYFRPTSLGQTCGAPGRATPSVAARNERTARMLWERTAELTGVPPVPA